MHMVWYTLRCAKVMQELLHKKYCTISILIKYKDTRYSKWALDSNIKEKKSIGGVFKESRMQSDD